MRLKVLLIAVAFCLMSQTAIAATYNLDYGNYQVILNLEPNEDAAYSMPVKTGDRLIVHLEVTAGGPVDFYLTNLTAYNLYAASVSGDLNFHSLYYLAEQTSEDSMEIQYTYDSLVDNELVVLIDNSGNTEGGAAPTGPVTVHGYINLERNVWTLQNIVITIAAIVTIALFMAYLKWPTKKG